MSHPPSDALARVLEEIDADANRGTGEQVAALVADYMARAARGEAPVSTPRSTRDLARRFDEPAPASGAPTRHVVDRIRRDVVDEANWLMHPMAMGHQVSAPLPIAAWMEALVGALNQSVAVAEMSPTVTPLEHRVVRWLCDLAGFGAGAGGTFTSGGTEATFSALLAARAAALPDALERGLGGALPVVLCGEHAHYAVKRAVAQLGLGMRRALAVASDGPRMSVAALEQTLDRCAAEGTEVMAVVATAGCTATGAFDDLEAIGALCEARGVWLHVDGAHGATALISPRHRHRLRGVARASSLAWDAHKMLLMPLAAGVLLVRDERRLDAAFAQSAPYLFHGGEDGRVWDQGVRSFMCSRRADVLKVWAALHRHGLEGLAALYDALVDTARALWTEVEARADFEAAHEPETNILCFRWVGDRTLDAATLDERNRALRERYNRSGRGWITTTVLDGRRWLRVTVMNPRTTRDHVGALIDQLAHDAASG